jgi:NAD-dependent dihydropyrimidine dehydrogenase PreA subunit
MKKESRCAVSGRFTTVEINEEVCNGCNMCVDVCVMDVFMENEEKGKPPIVAYPEECWFDGSCVEMCPQRHKGAIRVRTPLPMKVSVLRGGSRGGEFEEE